MTKIWIVIQREYLRRVKKKSFIILTLLMPFLMVALVAVPLWLSSIKSDEQHLIAVADYTGLYAQHLPLDNPELMFVAVPGISDEMKTDSSIYQAVVTIQPVEGEVMPKVTVYSREEVQTNLLTVLEQSIGQQVRQQKLAATGIENLEQIIQDLDQDVSIQTYKWNDEGEESSSNTGLAIGAGFLFTFLIYMFVMAYGGMVMQSVIEEKTSRIVEIMVSSIKPFQLMMGKIIGIMLVGFTQIALWGATVGAVFAMVGSVKTVEADVTAEVMQSVGSLPLGELGLMFVVMFLGGYLLYASFFAAVGASVNEQEDSSQFILPVTLIMVFGLYAAMYSIENTNGPLAYWASLFPLTSPIVMMVRIPFGVPLWQELLSIGLLYVTALLMVWVGAKIYRVGILMYGKKPSLKEMLKWLKY